MKRDSLTIVSEILYHALGSASKTAISNSCNLTTKICKKYITILLEKGLLKKEKDNFNTTEKGKQFLATYQKLELIWST